MRLLYLAVSLLITVCGVYAQNIALPPSSECPWQCQIQDGDKTYLYATCYQPLNNPTMCNSSYINMTECTSSITVDSNWGYLECAGATAWDAFPSDGQCEQPSECVSNSNAIRLNETPHKAFRKNYKRSK